jgi:hypothetical protein
MSHTEKQKLEVANVMAKDFLSIQRGCTYKDLTDVDDVDPIGGGC